MSPSHVGTDRMRPPALAVLLDRGALKTFGGDRSDEQRGESGGGDGDGEVTHGVFLLGVVMSLAVPDWIFHIICLCEIYIHGNVIYAGAPRKRSIIVNATSYRMRKICNFNILCCYASDCPQRGQIACAITAQRATPLKQHKRSP
jgi:hypothetical protein